MRSAVQVSLGVFHVYQTPLLRLRRGPGSNIVCSHRNVHNLQKASAANPMRMGCWLFVLLVLGTLALAQQPMEAVPGTVLQHAPRLRVFDNELSAANSLAQLPRRALPSIHSTDSGFLNPEACANHVADLADRQWQAELTSGKRLAADIERQVNLITDPAITEYLNRLELAIIRNSHLRKCCVVKLVNDVENNAYSLPGGFLYVNTGLILNSDNEAELVAALAHETGHVTARHFTKIEARRRLWRRFSLVEGPAGYALGWPLGQLFSFKLLRNAEFEADRLALKYQSASGYDPIELAHLLQHASSQEGERASFFARLFETHPSTGMRIKRVTQATGRYPQSQTDYVVDTSEFHEVRRRVANLMGVANPDLLTPQDGTGRKMP